MQANLADFRQIWPTPFARLGATGRGQGIRIAHESLSARTSNALTRLAGRRLDQPIVRSRHPCGSNGRSSPLVIPNFGYGCYLFRPSDRSADCNVQQPDPVGSARLLDGEAQIELNVVNSVGQGVDHGRDFTRGEIAFRFRW